MKPSTQQRLDDFSQAYWEWLRQGGVKPTAYAFGLPEIVALSLSKQVIACYKQDLYNRLQTEKLSGQSQFKL